MKHPDPEAMPSNKKLAESLERYLTAKGSAAPTIRAYLDAVNRLVDSLGAASVVDVERGTIGS